MALYEMTGNSLKTVDPATFTELGLMERQNIQKALREHVTAITPNVKTMVLAEEFGDWVGANRRIDLLCLDEQANLVVVELKRDNAAHMELQAVRYAAMISTMRFEQAVEAHRKYLISIGSSEEPAQIIREFLGAEEDEVIALSDKVRIVLAAAEFSPELTTTVLWLNKQGLDLRCVQMRPHPLADRILLDIQQVIPLPQAEQYQVAVREKSMEQDAARVRDRDVTRYDLTVGDHTFPSLPKRRLMLGVVTEALRQGLSLSDVEKAAAWQGNMFVAMEGFCDPVRFRDALGAKKIRYFLEDENLFHIDDRTYALSNQWGEGTLESVENVIARMPNPSAISYVSCSRVVEELAYGSHVVRRRETGTIEVEKDGIPVMPVMPVLREMAKQLQILQTGGSGNALNTRQLGRAVIDAIRCQ